MGREGWWVKQKVCGDGGLGRFLHLQYWMMMALKSQMGILLLLLLLFYYHRSGN
jgi:hypothetical protein